MSSSIRVLHVIPSVGIRTGGPAISVIGLARALQEIGVDPVIFSTNAASLAGGAECSLVTSSADLPIGADEVTINLFPMRSPRRLIFSPELWRALHKQAVNFDLIHIHSLNLYPQFAAWRAACRARKPYIISTHGALDTYHRRRNRMPKHIMDWAWQQRMVDGAAIVHVGTEKEHDRLLDRHFRAPVRMVSFGVDLAPFQLPASSTTIRQQFGLEQNFPLIVTHGRLSPVKGLDILVETLAQVSERHAKACLLLIGPDDEGYAVLLRRHAAKLGVSDRVLLIGALHGKQLRVALEEADIWVSASHSESFGMAVIEAMASGCVVIASPQVAIANEAGLAGALMVADNTPSALTEAILDLIDYPAKREFLSRRASVYARRFDWPEVAAQFRKMYCEVIEK